MAQNVIEKVNSKLEKADNKMEHPVANDDPFCDCIRYFFFLVIFTVMCMCGRTLDEHNFWISNQFRSSFEIATFNDVIEQGQVFGAMSEVEDIYLFLTQVAMPLLFVNSSYNNEPLIETEKNFVLGQNKLLGGVRLTIIRSNMVDCKFAGLPDEFSPCYSKYTSGSTNKSNYFVSGYEMPYLTASEAKSTPFSAFYMEYEGDGNIFDLDEDPTTAYIELEDIWYGGLIKRDARVLFFDFVTLNPNFNLHTVGRLCFELPVDGGVITYSQIKTWRFWKYLGSRGKILFVMEIIIVLMVVYYTWEEMFEVYTQGFVEYKKNPWNLVDWINIIFFYLTIIWRIRVVLSDSPSMTNYETYESYRYFVWLFSMEAYFNMVNGLLLYFKLFKYLNASKKMRLLFRVFYKTAADMFTFIVILCVFYMAYGLCGYLIFSSDVSDFRELKIAIMNLFRYTVTDMDYEALKQSSISTGTLYYVSWTLIIVLVLVNVVVAILSEGFEEVQEENKNSPEEFTLTKFIPKSFRKLIFQKIDTNQDGFLDEYEFAAAHGIDVKKAKEIIEKYDVNNDGKMDMAEFDRYYMQSKS